jgi:hypothetical protein
VFNTKLVELEILKISYLGNFSSCYMILGAIGENSLYLKSFGGELQCPVNQSRAAHGMGAGEPPGGFRDLLARARTASATSRVF